jgi:hypothetical protein
VQLQRNGSYTRTLGTSEKNQRQRLNLLQKDKKMETADPQNSTFANRTNRLTSKVCKRAVFFANVLIICIFIDYKM